MKKHNGMRPFDVVVLLKIISYQHSDWKIRDLATANMAIRAALTGHLVLSTIHTNSAWATISRLIEMGVPSFLIASTLNISIAQRLVRKLCSCKTKQEINSKIVPLGFQIPEELKFHFIAIGCEKCYQTGYVGRKAIYEIIPIDKELVGLIKNNQMDIDDYLEMNNIQTLKKNAIDLIIDGSTSVDEVFSLLMN